jgi:hypothetical protein
VTLHVRSAPTHRLTIEVPLDLTAADPPDYHVVEEAMRVVVACSRLAVDRFVCGDLTVRIEEVPT